MLTSQKRRYLNESGAAIRLWAVSAVCTLTLFASAAPTSALARTATDKSSSDDGLCISANRDGSACLRCVGQNMTGQATPQGLWLISTLDNARREPFRVKALAVKRSAAGLPLQTSSQIHANTPSFFPPLPATGTAQASDNLVRYYRPGLTEEYSVSREGVRQDFIIDRRPPGEGLVELELAVDGARAMATAQGAQLVLADGGRKIACHRLKAFDQLGKELPARMEVQATNLVVVVFDDANAQYPVRVDPTLSDLNFISLDGTTR